MRLTRFGTRCASGGRQPAGCQVSHAPPTSSPGRWTPSPYISGASSSDWPHGRPVGRHAAADPQRGARRQPRRDQPAAPLFHETKGKRRSPPLRPWNIQQKSPPPWNTSPREGLPQNVPQRDLGERAGRPSLWRHHGIRPVFRRRIGSQMHEQALNVWVMKIGRAHV